MALDFANEQWVRVYRRDTVTLKLLTWQGRALLWELIRKADRAGVIDVGDHGDRGLAALVAMPVEVVTVAVVELLSSGILHGGAGCYVLPRFLEAQETASSDAVRQRESRSRRRADAMSGDSHVTKRDQLSQNVTDSHVESRAVTSGHAVSRAVTLRQEETRQEEKRREEVQVVSAEPTSALSAVRKRGKKSAVLHPDEALDVTRVLEKLSRESNVAYRGSRVHVGLIVDRLRDGITADDMIAVIAFCAYKKGWKGDEKMHEHLTPNTLFGPQNIERYLDPARSWAATLIDDAPPFHAEQGAPS